LKLHSRLCKIEVLTAVSTKATFIWDVMLFGVVEIFLTFQKNLLPPKHLIKLPTNYMASHHRRLYCVCWSDRQPRLEQCAEKGRYCIRLCMGLQLTT